MSHKKKHSEEDESGGHEVGLWYVSFSDMITLLLSFFVMLATFSSYDKQQLDKFSGVWTSVSDYSVFPTKYGSQVVPPYMDHPVDFTPKGSEKPGQTEPGHVESPGESEWLADMTQAYDRRRVLRIPASRLFWAQGSKLTPSGKMHLSKLAALVNASPCQVLIGQYSSGNDAEADRRGLERAYTIKEFLQKTESVQPELLGLAVPQTDNPDGFGKQEVMEIILLSWRLTK